MIIYFNILFKVQWKMKSTKDSMSQLCTRNLMVDRKEQSEEAMAIEVAIAMAEEIGTIKIETIHEKETTMHLTIIIIACRIIKEVEQEEDHGDKQGEGMEPGVAVGTMVKGKGISEMSSTTEKKETDKAKNRCQNLVKTTLTSTLGTTTSERRSISTCSMMIKETPSKTRCTGLKPSKELKEEDMVTGGKTEMNETIEITIDMRVMKMVMYEINRIIVIVLIIERINGSKDLERG